MTAGPLAAANLRRHEAAGWRDAVLARRIIRDPAVWVLLDGFQRRIVETRAARSPATWAELAARLHVTKDTATGAWRHLLTWPQITRLKETPMPEEPIVAWEDVEAALRATGCDREEAWAAVPHSLVVVVPSVGAAMLFAAELTLRLTGFGGRLVHAPDEVADILARTSDSWVMTGRGEEDLPVLALTFPGVIVTGDPPAGPPPGVDGTAALGFGTAV
jgi:hypothetical protein